MSSRLDHPKCPASCSMGQVRQHFKSLLLSENLTGVVTGEYKCTSDDTNHGVVCGEPPSKYTMLFEKVCNLQSSHWIRMVTVIVRVKNTFYG